jgi:hypothetical protein
MPVLASAISLLVNLRHVELPSKFILANFPSLLVPILFTHPSLSSITYTDWDRPTLPLSTDFVRLRTHAIDLPITFHQGYGRDPESFLARLTPFVEHYNCNITSLDIILANEDDESDLDLPDPLDSLLSASFPHLKKFSIGHASHTPVSSLLSSGPWLSLLFAVFPSLSDLELYTLTEMCCGHTLTFPLAGFAAVRGLEAFGKLGKGWEAVTFGKLALSFEREAQDGELIVRLVGFEMEEGMTSDAIYTDLNGSDVRELGRFSTLRKLDLSGCLLMEVRF